MNTKAFTIAQVHKDTISIGDAIMHDGRDRTVCAKDITRSELFGVHIFGDSYHNGHKPVDKLIYNNPLT